HPGAGLRHPERTVEIDVDHVAEGVGCLPARWHRAPDARIVDEDVDPAELPCRRIDQGLAFLGHPYVGAPNEYVCPARPELEGQLVEPLLTPGSEDQRGTHGCEGPSDSHPEPGARA